MVIVCVKVFVLVVLFRIRRCVDMVDVKFWLIIVGLGEDGLEGLFVVSFVVL